MIFVTGGTGLLGSHLLYELSKESEGIRAIYRTENRINLTKKIFKYYNSENWESQFNKIEWVEGDILDIPKLTEQIEANSIVYHCAAMVSFHPKDFNELIRINRDGTDNIVNVCLANNVKKLCYVSSTAAIGGEDNRLLNEDEKWKMSPDTAGYTISKYSAEKEVWRGIEEGLNAVMINPCLIFGAGRWEESSLAIFNNVKKGYRFYPPGSNASVDARDLASILVMLANSEISSERFLCIGSNQKFKVLIDEIATQLEVRKPTKLVSRTMVNIARKLIGFTSFFSGKKPAITKETVNSLFSNKSYSSNKIEKALGVKFRPLSEQVENTIKGRIY